MCEITIYDHHLNFIDDLIKAVELKILQEQSTQQIIDNGGKTYYPTSRKEVVNAMIEIIQQADFKDKVIENLTNF